eukprot:gene28044-36929_t
MNVTCKTCSECGNPSGRWLAVIPSTIGNTISSSAFLSCSIIGVIIPTSVEIISSSAFEKSKVISVVIPTSAFLIGEKAFYGTTYLKSIVIPTSVVSIGRYAFRRSALESLTLPSSVTVLSFGAFQGTFSYLFTALFGAFQNDSALQCVFADALDFGKVAASCKGSCPLISSCSGSPSFRSTFYPTTTAAPQRSPSLYPTPYPTTLYPSFAALSPSPVITNVPCSTCASCGSRSGLWVAVIPSTAYSVGDSAFSSCSLSGVVIPTSVVGIGSYAFYGTTALKSIVIPTSVVSIGRYAFRRSALESLTLPSSVTVLSFGAFQECKNLTIVDIKPNPFNSLQILSGAFQNDSALQCVVANPSDFGKVAASCKGSCPLISSCSGSPSSAKSPTTRPTFLIPTSINFYYYNGKYYSTLANVDLNGYPRCQSIYYYLPTDWVLAPDDIDSKYAISFNTWSTTTVVVASGVGYYSASSAGFINTAYSKWLYTYYSAYYGNSYVCVSCNCQILIMYSPPRSPSVYPTPYPIPLYPSFAAPSPSPVITNVTCSMCASCGSHSGLWVAWIPSTTYFVYTYAFSSCSLSGVVIPTSVVGIESYAFYGTTALKSIVIPTSVVSIGRYAFRRSALESLTLPSSVTVLNLGAFQECKNLITVDIKPNPSNSLQILSGAFQNDSALQCVFADALDFGKVAASCKGSCPLISSCSRSPSVYPTLYPSKSPMTILIPTSINFYYYNGKYYSTLANVVVNGSPRCQSTSYYYLPTDWVLAPDDIDSKYAISFNTWSTTTVVVASGVGYYSASSAGFIDKAYSNWLYTYYSAYYGNSYMCVSCNCQILIMYSPYPKTLKPSYQPAVYYKSSSTKTTSSGGNSSLYSLIVLPVFIMVGGLVFYLRYRRRISMQMQQVQVQPVAQMTNSTGCHEQPTINNSNYGMAAMSEPIVYDSSIEQQQQPYIHTQPGYIQLQPQPQLQQANQIQGYGYYVQTQPEPQGYGYGQHQPQGYGYGRHQPEPQGYGYGQYQPEPQGYGYGQYQPAPQGYGYGQHQPAHQQSPALPQAQLVPSGVDYYTQPQPYNPAVVYPAVGAHVPPSSS